MGCGLQVHHLPILSEIRLCLKVQFQDHEQMFLVFFFKSPLQMKPFFLFLRGLNLRLHVGQVNDRSNRPQRTSSIWIHVQTVSSQLQEHRISYNPIKLIIGPKNKQKLSYKWLINRQLCPSSLWPQRVFLSKELRGGEKRSWKPNLPFVSSLSSPQLGKSRAD